MVGGKRLLLGDPGNLFPGRPPCGWSKWMLECANVVLAQSTKHEKRLENICEEPHQAWFETLTWAGRLKEVALG